MANAQVKTVMEQAGKAVAVVVATKGRCGEVRVLLDCLMRQTHAPSHVAIIGAEPADVAGLADHPLRDISTLGVLVSATASAATQRNDGIQWLTGTGVAFFSVAFFDDDFRPAESWIERAVHVLDTEAGVVGATGRVLADGVNGRGLEEVEAQDFIRGRRSPQPHWSADLVGRDVESLYGCNMIVRGSALRSCRFDDALPLYSWQEDCDFSGQLRRLGRTKVVGDCVGVHLGVKRGRTSGLRFGYSQIANPIRIANRGNMTWVRALRFVGRALIANSVKSLRSPGYFDYRGRLRGNMHALSDLALGQCAPNRILTLS